MGTLILVFVISTLLQGSYSIDVCNTAEHYAIQARHCTYQTASAIEILLVCGSDTTCYSNALSAKRTRDQNNGFLQFPDCNTTYCTDGSGYTTFPSSVLNGMATSYTEQKICRDYVSDQTNCFNTAFASCDANFTMQLSEYRQRYFHTICSSSVVHDHILYLKGKLPMNIAQLTGVPSACNATKGEAVFNSSRCYQKIRNINQLALYNQTDFLGPFNFLDAEFNVSRMAKDAYACMLYGTQMQNCSNAAFTGAMALQLYVTDLPVGTNVSMFQILERLNMTLDVNSAKRANATVFGDPHFTYYNQVYLNESGPVTCAAPGWQTYLHNQYVNITALNTKVQTSDATYITAVNVTFLKANKTVANYYTDTGALATTFTINSDANEASINTSALGSNLTAVIPWYKNISVTITKISNTYMMVVRMADNMFANSEGLLVNGCPESAINTTQFEQDIAVGRRRRALGTLSGAKSTCGSLTGNFYYKCVYDMVQTNDQTIALAASQYLTQMETISVTQDSTGGPSNTNSPATSIHSALVVIIMTVLITIGTSLY